MLKNLGIGTKLTIVGTLIVVIPLACLAIVALTIARTGLEQISDQQLTSRAQEIAHYIDGIYGEEMKIAQSLANNPAIVAAATERETSDGGAEDSAGLGEKAPRGLSDAVATASAQIAPFRNIRALATGYEALNIVDTKGVVFASSDPKAIGLDVTARDYFKTAIAGHSNIGTSVLSMVTQRPMTPVATPIMTEGKIVGVFTLILNFDFLDTIAATEKIGTSGYAFIIDGTGLAIVHPVADKAFTLNIFQIPEMMGLAREMMARRSGVARYTYEGVPQAVGYAPVSRTGWSVGLCIPIREYMAAADGIQTKLIGGSLGAMIIALLVFLLFSRSITAPLSQGVAFAQQVAAGDFTQQLSVGKKDEIGVLVQALNNMSLKLKGMVAAVVNGAQQVASSSEMITGHARKLAEGAQSQASTLEETSAAVEELAASVDQVSDHAQSQSAAVEQGAKSMAHVHQSIEDISNNLAEIAGLAGRSVDNAREGAKAVSDVLAGIDLIATGSERIGGIVTVISDIADQTNLLSLNASIEAARAGEHGRGFAVVADEVSKLADRSAASAKEIEGLIRESVRNVTQGVQTARGSQAAMEQIRAASQKVQEMITGLSESLIQQVGAVKELSNALASVAEMSQSISAATEEQTTNARQVSAAVEDVNAVAQNAASAAEEMSVSTEELAHMAQELQRQMAQFKIGGTEPTDVDLNACSGEKGSGDGSGACGKLKLVTVDARRSG